MRPLFISNDPSIFIPESATHARMKAYADLFGELHILGRGNVTKEEGYGSLHLYSVRVSKPLSPFVLGSMARRVIRRHGITVVSAQDPFEHGWAALRAVRGTDAALHVQIHTDFLSPWFTDVRGVSSLQMRLLNRIRIRIADYVLPRAAGIRVVSKRISDSLVRRYGNKLTTVPRVIPLTVSSVVPPKALLPGEKFPFTLITASRLESEKRIEDILYAIARIKDRYPGVGLYIVGQGREEGRLKHITASLHLEDRVRFINEWRSDAWGLIQDGHAFIQVSAYEGYGRTLLEAALARIPIITSDVGIVGEVFTGYRDVLAVPPGDPAAIAVQIVGLIEDEQARHSLILHAQKAAEEHLRSLPPLAESLRDHLEETIKTGNNLRVPRAVIEGK